MITLAWIPSERGKPSNSLNRRERVRLKPAAVLLQKSRKAPRVNTTSDTIQPY